MTPGDLDIAMTSRALDLASKGKGLVSPNPLVGCVIVDDNGVVAGEGFYTYDGVIHAEVAALNQAGERARRGTAYVSLEPHAHHGKTPPCTDALINAGIARVVAPINDPNPLVSGNGFERLRQAGIEVQKGILESEASALNEQFICWHRKRRPFVHLKLAVSLDGRISLKDSISTALTSSEARQRVQELRHNYDAILVGGNTALVDDPILTDRSGLDRRRPLVRVILDNRLRVSPGSRLGESSRDIPTIIFSGSDEPEKVAKLETKGIEIVRQDPRCLRSVLAELYRREIQGILVEGGTEVAGAFCDARLVDKVTFIAAPLVIGGPAAPVAVGGRGAESLDAALSLTNLTVSRLGDDVEITGYGNDRDSANE
jgi:diaminohydroxyphosphoribosylaminopyrimidine deaminase/5-amino-6-(5-phosphoribosylamino)uracil reductase